MVDRTTSDPIVGRLLDGRYQVGPKIARGGMATVYEALDLRLDRQVALKVMHSGLGDDADFARRFVREARAAARLSHPHVVGVFDQGDDDGTLFLAMEYVPGRTLRDLLRAEAPLPPTRALTLLEPVLAALGAAHAAGLVHRDVKPENVLLADDGRIKVADFGLARAVSAETHHTATGGVLIGTVSYLAPELVVDSVADARADVYAVGVLLYEMLTGTKPHDGESAIQIAYKHVHEDVPPPSRVQRGIPPYLDALVARATSRDRAQRPADARVLLHHVHRVRQALESGLADDPDLVADLRPRPAVFPADHSGEGDTRDDLAEELAALSRAAGFGGAEDGVHGGATSAIPTDPWADGDEEPRTLPARSAAAVHQAPGIPARPHDRSPVAAATPIRPSRARRRRRALVLLLTLALLGGVVAGGWYLAVARYTTTPGVINLSQADARAKVEAAGLELEVADEVYSETVAAGSVISTDPAAGSRILDGGTVAAVISLGPERYEVPALRGETLADATSALEELRLEVGDVRRRYHERIPEGAVIASDPEAGTVLRPGAGVDLVVSRGRRPIEVVDFTGRDADRAEQELTDAGLRVERTAEFSDTVPEGRVISQNPTSGTLFRRDVVRLVVSRGPELVEVPRVNGVGVEEATRRLREAGFEVATRRSNLYVGLEYVVDSDPGQGERAPRGSTVTLVLV